MKTASLVQSYSRWALVILLSLFYIYPLYMLVVFSLKSNENMFSSAFGLTGDFHFSNYVEAWTASNFERALFNSGLISIISVVVMILLGAMASYPLARRQGKLSTFLNLFFVAGLIVPMQLNLIPLFKMMSSLNLNHSHLGVILLYISFGLPLTIFLFTGFMRSLPLELEEAAQIDGSSRTGIFFRILLPLLKPIATSVFILQFLTIWNDFFLPVVFLNTDKLQTVQVAVYSFAGRYDNDWSHMFPMIVISIAPVMLLYIFLQRFIIAGIMSGAVKG
ncbi:carbohydrate ABC transporter permease [Paenibacillus illinoisensis]|uniref:carbohydrate ABC transporter permease n=1 Tax=Paenibacillus illinoisensis TaxID=59845 RepID=UPI001C8E7EC9|nr:carbohydrate ABC transporter permease [Paenibacillus illinoisensis]MBY0217795.1 carbohydrate ABC transporter permease [Paenibacillus illinoisensis]